MKSIFASIKLFPFMAILLILAFTLNAAAYTQEDILAVPAAAISGDLSVSGDRLIIYDDGYYSLDGGITLSTNTIGADTQIRKTSGSLTIELQNTEVAAAKLISVPSGNLTVTGGGELNVDNQDVTEMSKISGIRVVNGDLTILEGSTLTAIGLDYGINVASSTSNITVTDGSTLIGEETGINSTILKAAKYGVYTFGSITVSAGSELTGIGTVPSYNTYGVHAYGGFDVSDSYVTGAGNTGVYSNRNGPIQVGNDGSVIGIGGSYSTSHGVQADYTNIIVDGGTLWGTSGGYAGVEASAGGIKVANGEIVGMTTGTGYDQYGVHVSGANDINVSDAGYIVGMGDYNGVYTSGGNITAAGGGIIEGYAYTYGYYSSSFGHYGAVIAKAGAIHADGGSEMIENYSKVEYFDDTFTMPYENGKNMTDYLNYDWSITEGTGAVESDPNGFGIRATVSGEGILTAVRTGNVIDEVVVLGDDSTHILNIPAELTAPLSMQYYSVTYDPNGADSGDFPVDSDEYLPGDTIIVKGNDGDLQKTAFIFSGWTLNPDGSGTVYNAEDNFVMGNEDIILYAKWDPVEQEMQEPGQIPPTGDNNDTTLLISIFSVLISCFVLFIKYKISILIRFNKLRKKR